MPMIEFVITSWFRKRSGSVVGYQMPLRQRSVYAVGVSLVEGATRKLGDIIKICSVQVVKERLGMRQAAGLAIRSRVS